VTALVLLLACTTALALAACVRFWRQRNRLGADNAALVKTNASLAWRLELAQERQKSAEAKVAILRGTGGASWSAGAVTR
jgi:hypothetical protein